MSRVVSVIDPQDIDNQGLKKPPAQLTPEYKFRVNMVKSVRSNNSEIIGEVDRQFSEFTRCMEIDDNGQKARKFLISVVDGTFECKYHSGRCAGEYDPRNELVIVSYKVFNKSGILPLLKHEWAHAYKLLKTDHSNMDEVIGCTRY